MGRLPKRAKSSKDEVQEFVSEEKIIAKQKALSLLEKCLDTQLLASEDIDKFIRATAIAIGASDEPDVDEQTDKNENSKIKTPSKPTSINRKKVEVDEHNEVCEVCERGGELICCDTCSLVFHLKCIRPVMTSVPKGSWSCAHCILEELADGDKNTAKQAVKAMSIEAEDSNSNARIQKSGDITIAHAGKKFIVRKVARKQIIEIGRFNNLQEALSSIPRVQQHRQPKTVTQRIHNTRHNTNTSDEEITCTYCFDDPFLQFCAFCGCKFCCGKFDSSLLVYCYGCQRESHSYCYTPSLTTLPYNMAQNQSTASSSNNAYGNSSYYYDNSGNNHGASGNTNSVEVNDPWYCDNCTEKQHQQQQQQSTMKTRKSLDKGNSSAPFTAVTTTLNEQDQSIANNTDFDPNNTSVDQTINKVPVYRGRGRPPGSSKKPKDPNQPTSTQPSKSSSRQVSMKSTHKHIAPSNYHVYHDEININTSVQYADSYNNEVNIPFDAIQSSALSTATMDVTPTVIAEPIVIPAVVIPSYEYIDYNTLLAHVVQSSSSHQLTTNDIMACDRITTIKHRKDLEKLLFLLQQQQLIIIDRIREQEPDFENKEEIVVKEEFKPLVAISNTLPSTLVKKEGEGGVGQKRKRLSSKDYNTAVAPIHTVPVSVLSHDIYHTSATNAAGNISILDDSFDSDIMLINIDNDRSFENYPITQQTNTTDVATTTTVDDSLAMDIIDSSPNSANYYYTSNHTNIYQHETTVPSSTIELKQETTNNSQYLSTVVADNNSSI